MRNEATKGIYVKVTLTYKEIEQAHEKMHPRHRELLDSYFGEDATPADFVFAISEIMKAIEE